MDARPLVIAAPSGAAGRVREAVRIAGLDSGAVGFAGLGPRSERRPPKATRQEGAAAAEDLLASDPQDARPRILWRLGMSVSELTAALEAMPSLEWVHSDFVGVDGLPLDLMAERKLVLTNGAGTFARPMAEWVVTALLIAAKQVPRFVRQSDAGIWDPGDRLAELEGARVLMLGFGSIGSLAAELLRPFGPEIVACVRKPRNTLPEGVKALAVEDQWKSWLGWADYLVCTLPLTRETENLIDEQVLSSLKPGCFLVNVSRGKVLDEEALSKALDDGRLAGAVLDAFAIEPLPADHRLFRRGNVLVLPHITWSSPRAEERMTRLFADNLARFAAGRPLFNVVDLEAGY